MKKLLSIIGTACLSATLVAVPSLSNGDDLISSQNELRMNSEVRDYEIVFEQNPLYLSIEEPFTNIWVPAKSSNVGYIYDESRMYLLYNSNDKRDIAILAPRVGTYYLEAHDYDNGGMGLLKIIVE